jgi:hypothetical protein
VRLDEMAGAGLNACSCERFCVEFTEPIDVSDKIIRQAMEERNDLILAEIKITKRIFLHNLANLGKREIKYFYKANKDKISA